MAQPLRLSQAFNESPGCEGPGLDTLEAKLDQRWLYTASSIGGKALSLHGAGFSYHYALSLKCEGTRCQGAWCAQSGQAVTAPGRRRTSSPPPAAKDRRLSKIKPPLGLKVVSEKNESVCVFLAGEESLQCQVLSDPGRFPNITGQKRVTATSPS